MTTFTKKTPQQIVDRIRWIRADGRDVFGTEVTDLLAFLHPKVAAKELPELFKPDAAMDWEPLAPEQGVVVGRIREYLPFAWGKANDCRGMSAARSLSHMSAWLWLLGLEDKVPGIHRHTHYGKPQLVAICELPEIAVDWKALDDGAWRNDETADGVSAEEVLGR